MSRSEGDQMTIRTAEAKWNRHLTRRRHVRISRRLPFEEYGQDAKIIVRSHEPCRALTSFCTPNCFE
jgi:hypothetical protein